MKLGIAIIGDISQEKANLIVNFSNNIKRKFNDKNYGSDVKSYTIGVVCITPQFEQFFKVKRPKYTKGKKIINPDGIPFILEDSLEYDVKLDFDTFNNASELEAKKILAKEILQSLKVLDDMKKKINDFDIIKFKTDLEDYFRNEGLV